MMLSTVQVIAAGTTGVEQIELAIDNVVVQSFSDLGSEAYSGNFVNVQWQTSQTIQADQVRVNFVNDLYDVANGIDRNVRIDAIVIDGVRFETEAGDVYSTGTWQAADGISPGFRQSEYLHSDGYFQFSGNTGNGTGSVIQVRASGEEGSEIFALQISGQTVATWNATSQIQTFQYTANENVTADQIKVQFLNDAWQPGVIDRNLVVDYISIDGSVFQTEASSVYSTGTWLPSDGITAGFRQSETLHSNGYFQFAGEQPNDPPPGNNDAINDILPDGWSHALFSNGTDVWLSTFDANGNEAFSFRFGATGAISDLVDQQTNQQLLAPSFQGEVTDRVIQWTLWEIGPNVRYDVPDLDVWGDRYNVTQAGTFNNLIHGTVDVDIDAANGVLDIWSVADHQWHYQLDNHISSTVTSLTRIEVLDGGALKVRRILFVDEIRLNGQVTTLDNPNLVSWTPFADSAFNSLALGFNQSGTPNHWYAEGQNITGNTTFAIEDTRGWATVYNRNNLSNGTIVSTVLGNESGTVHLSDGTETDMRRFLFSALDFDGGIALNPSLWPAPLPNGSFFDQTLILLPGRGVSPTTGATLDALAAEVPPPQVYHPGANMDSELSAIADRLRNLKNEPRTATDHIGQIG